MAGQTFSSRINNDDPYVQQVDVRAGLTAVQLYPYRTAPPSGSVEINKVVSVSGADAIYIISAGNIGAETLTLKFMLFGKQIGDDVTVTVPAQTDGKVHHTEVYFSDLLFCDNVVITGQITAGSFSLHLGKKGLS